MIDKKIFIHKKEEEFLEKVNENLVLKCEIEDYYKNFYVKERIPDLLGKTVKITEKQFPDIYLLMGKICKVLEMDNVDAYVFEDFYYGVESKGIDEYWIEISAKTIDDLTLNQISFLLAKELYNIKFKNTYYSSLISRSIKNFEMVNISGMNISAEALKVSMYKWHRIMNFSSDNFAYVICGSLKDSIDVILLTILNNKRLVSNVNLGEYIKQANKIDSLDDEVYNNTKLDEMVPYGPYRVKNLISYASSIRAKEAKLIININ